jgi:hypothetical protein
MNMILLHAWLVGHLRQDSGCRVHGQNFPTPPLNGENRMTRILFVGQKPETVDFSDPSLPPGFDASKINAGSALLRSRGGGVSA